MPAPARILLIRPSALGDVCRTVPLVASLRKAYPDAAIDWLVQSGFEQAVLHHPAVSRVISFPRRDIALTRLWRPSAARTLLRLLKDLRRGGYDLVIDAQGLARSGFFAWCTRAPERVGYANARELGWLGLTRRVDAPTTTHAVDRMMSLIRALGIENSPDMRLYTSETDRNALSETLQGARYAVVAPTSRWAGKRWPADRFATLMGSLLGDGKLDAIALVGAHTERNQCAPITQQFSNDSRVVDLIGRTDVGGLMVTVQASSIVIANDSAALHMAVGFDRPMVGLFGPTRIDRVGPYLRAQDVIQPEQPPAGISHKHAVRGVEAMRRIAVTPVIDAALQRLNAGPVQSSLERPGTVTSGSASGTDGVTDVGSRR